MVCRGSWLFEPTFCKVSSNFLKTLWLVAKKLRRYWIGMQNKKTWCVKKCWLQVLGYKKEQPKKLRCFFSEQSLVFTEIHRIVEFIQTASFNRLVQSTVDAENQSNEYASSSVVTTTEKLLVNSFHGYQKSQCTWRTKIKYLNQEKTHRL